MKKKRKQKITWQDLSKSEKIIVIIIRFTEIFLIEATFFQFGVLTLEKLLK